MTDEQEVAECAICWGGTAEDYFARLPCCTAPVGSSMRYCQRCVEIICEEGPGGVGRCPTCRSFIRKTPAGGGFECCDAIETCNMCNQPRQIVHRQGDALKVCDACFMGAHQRIRYECERCRCVRHIPHPMYRYQPSAAEFGNNSWFCRRGPGGVGGGCDDFTNWRVYPADVHEVPAHDAPDSWGRREDWLARVREQRRREMAGRVERGEATTDDRLRGFLSSGKLLIAIGAILAWVHMNS